MRRGTLVLMMCRNRISQIVSAIALHIVFAQILVCFFLKKDEEITFFVMCIPLLVFPVRYMAVSFKTHLSKCKRIIIALIESFIFTAIYTAFAICIYCVSGIRFNDGVGFSFILIFVFDLICAFFVI